MGFYRSFIVSTRQPCKFEYDQPYGNYFGVTQPYGLIVDAEDRIFFDDNTNLNWKRVKCEGTCGGFYGIQTLLLPGTSSTCMSLVDDTNEPDHFFEVFAGMTGLQGIWKQQKDGSARVQIYNTGVGQNPSGAGWDASNEMIVWTVDSGAPIGRVYRCNRNGGAVSYWDIWTLLSFQARGVNCFADGRLILYDVTNNLIKLFSGFGGGLIQSYTSPMPPGTPIWFSMDDVNNRVYYSNNGYVGVYDVASNSCIATHNWGVSYTQTFYSNYTGWCYARKTSGIMSAWNYSRGESKTWTGAYYLRKE